MMENKEEVSLCIVPRTEMEARRNNYKVTIGSTSFQLIRNVDFGKVPKAKTPSLWKPGAEKILLGYGLYYDTVITDTYKDHANGYFYYEVMARAYDQQGRVVRTGVGCSNTSESGNGNASGFNSANNVLKKAKKRAVVDLALTLGSLSNAFTQDLEDENNQVVASELVSDNDFINAKQSQRLFAIAATKGLTIESAKTYLKSLGFESTKTITQKDYDMLCDKFQHYGEEPVEKKGE